MQCFSGVQIKQVAWLLCVVCLCFGTCFSFAIALPGVFSFCWNVITLVCVIVWLFLRFLAANALFSMWLQLCLLLALCYLHLTLYNKKWLAWAKHVNPTFSVCQLRQDFRNCPLRQPEEGHGAHTHPIAARSRGDAAKLAHNLAAERGLVPFSYQMSAADVRHGIEGSRQWFWSKDVMVSPTDNSISDDNLVYAIDVDYYLDMNKFLSGLPDVPVLLHTFNPRAAAYVGKEYSFKFMADGRVNYIVNEATYDHWAWNWNHDVLSVGNSWFRRYYLVERRQADEHHDYVLLIPIGAWRGLFATLCDSLSSTPLRRLIPNTIGDFMRLSVKMATGLCVSIARFNTYNSIRLPADRFDSIMRAADLTKLPYNMASVQSWLDGNKEHAGVLLDYIRHQVDNGDVYVSESVVGARSYQLLFNAADYEHDVKPIMLPFASAIIPAGFVPDASIANEMLAVEGRIKIPTVDSHELMKMQDCSDHQLLHYFTEFIHMLFPIKGCVHPVNIEDVYAQQSRPNQRSLLDLADGLPWMSDLFKTFIKKEAYQKPSYPRIITTVNTSRKREYARFVLALAEYLKRFSWYGPGKTPREIAEGIASAATLLAALYCADADKMDGHVSGRFRTFEKMVLHAAFDPSYWAELDELHAAHFGKLAVTVLAVFYQTQFQRGSGENATTAFNTLFSKVMDYVARRMAGQLPRQAFEAFGIFAGDDGIADFSSLTHKDIIAAGRCVGQRLEVDVFRRGEAGVNFLSRYYTHKVWFGEPASSCDIVRTLSKFHLSLNLDQFTPLEKLTQKLAGLLRTDSNTPLIQDLINMAIRLGLNLDCTLDRRMSTWFSGFETETNWPNDVDFEELDWLYTLCPGACVDEFRKHCAECTSENCLAFPMIFEPKPPKVVVPTVCDGEMHLPSEKVCHKFILGQCKGVCTLKHVKGCRDYLAGNCKRRKCTFPHVK